MPRVLLLLCALQLSCLAKMADEAPAASRAAPPTTTASGEVGKEKAAVPKEPTASPRKIIRNGELEVVVNAYQPARRAIEELVRRSGGYLASSTVDHSLGQVSSATLVLRVPAGSFDDIAGRIARLGTVVRESTGTRDITEEYYDLKARLSNARKLEARLLELLASKQTARVQDLLEVERELARVRGEIERFEGKLRLYDNLVDLSTITVRLRIEERYVPPRPPTLGEDARSTLRDSWRALGAFGRGLLLVAVALAPWLIPIAATLWLAVHLIRRWRRARAARRAASSAAAATSPSPGQPPPAAPGA